MIDKRLLKLDLCSAPDVGDVVDLNGLTELLNDINNVLGEIKSVNDKGFINEISLESYPVVREYYKDVLRDDVALGDFGKDDILECYKWVYNLIVLHLYEKCLISIKMVEENITNEDLMRDYQQLSKDLYGMLDPSIRLKLQKKGIGVLQNTYTGFDTEYKNLDFKWNKLLSVQLAVNTKLLLKLPIYDEYELSSVDTLTSKVYPIKGGSNKLNYQLIKEIINSRIKEIRSMKYNLNDYSINILHQKLEGLGYDKQIIKGYVYYSFPRTIVEKLIIYPKKEGYSFKELIKQSNEMASKHHKDSYEALLDLLVKLHDGVDLEKVSYASSLEISESKWRRSSNTEGLVGGLKRLSRTNHASFTDDRVSVTKVRNNYLIGHYTAADLSILRDFEEMKENFDIVNKSFVTLSKPICVDNVNVYIRDTMLLAPPGKASLGAIGSLYGDDFNKVDLTNDQIENMDVLLKENKKLFDDYAIKDALIALVHGTYMEDFNFKIGCLGVPITLSGLSSKTLKRNWEERGYKGYQISSTYLLGSAGKVQTPKGLQATSGVGLHLSNYIANYKGGRNESFMYGSDKKEYWYDYDLTSAYTSVMAMMGNPDYKKGRVISRTELKSLSDEELLYSYVIINCTFLFPKNTMFPSIPCYIDDVTTIYPLEGEAVLTGSEYLIAQKQGAVIEVKEVYYIPFEKIKTSVGGKGKGKGRSREEYVISNHPFKPCIKELQAERKKYPKGSIQNLLIKLRLNGLYGLVVRGMSNKLKYDVKTGAMIRMEGDELSNPILASWITALIRSIIGELLYKVDLLGGKVVSVTTDGFITNIPDLEVKILALEKDENMSLIKEYRKIREELSGDPSALEVKHEGVGMISWSTRGQFGKDSKIMATTGFQRTQFDVGYLEKVLLSTLKSKDKSVEFTNKSLRSAIDVYKKGGHVTMIYKDQVFRLHYDNRRVIEVPEDLKGKYEFHDVLLNSKPVQNKDFSLITRYVSKLQKSRIYNVTTSTGVGNTYKSYKEVAVRSFIKGYFSRKYNLKGNEFRSYDELIKFVQCYDEKYKITKSNLSTLKNRKASIKPVPRKPDTVAFVEYVKRTLPWFDEKEFYI